MRKLILSMLTSVDGFIEGENGDMSWYIWDKEMTDYMMEVFQTVDAFVYGRKAYEMMAEFWPNQKDEFASIMNQMPKYVFSRTLNKAKWNATIIQENIPERIRNIKQQKGKNLIFYAGAEAATELMKHQLIDEYRLIVCPVVLGKGKSLFGGLDHKMNLKLRHIQHYSCGNVILTYVPEFLQQVNTVN